VHGTSPDEIDAEVAKAYLEAIDPRSYETRDDEVLGQILQYLGDGNGQPPVPTNHLFLDHGQPEQWDSIPECPPVSDLYELHTQHLENRKEHTSVTVEVPSLGILQVEYSYLSLVENPRNIFVVFGGGVPSVDSYKSLGYLLAWHGAEHGNAVILLPSPMNGDVAIISPEEKAFAQRYYHENRAVGPFSADGRIMAYALEHIIDRHSLNGNLRAVGLSTGGAQAIRTVQEAFRRNRANSEYIHPSLADKIAGIYPINSGGMYPMDVYRNPRKRFVAAVKLAAGFAAEMTGIATNWEQVVINLLDAGSPARSFTYLVRQAHNCVFPGIQELAAVLPETVDATAVMAHKNIGDKAIPAEMTMRALEEITPNRGEAGGRGNATVSVLVLPGNHGTPLEVGNSVAITLNTATLEDEDLVP
jgi:hypothetical protein